MNLSAKSIGWHLGSMAAAGWAVLVFAQSNAVDVYAIIGQLKKTWGELTVLFTMLGPVFAIAGAAYRTYSMKQVPSAAIAIQPLPGNPMPSNVKLDDQHAVVSVPGVGPTVGKVVGCLLALVLLSSLVATSAQAERGSYGGSCWGCMHGCDAAAEASNCGTSKPTPVASPAVPPAPSPEPKKKRPNIKHSGFDAFAQATGLRGVAQRNDVNNPAKSTANPFVPATTSDTMDVGGNKITDAILAKILPDLRYAAALSKQNNNKVTQPCLAAVLRLVDSWQVEVKDDAGKVLALPEPHVITFIEKQSQLLRQLQPDSDVSLGCSSMAQALKKDILSLVGGIMSGGVLGVLKLPIP